MKVYFFSRGLRKVIGSLFHPTVEQERNNANLEGVLREYFGWGHMAGLPNRTHIALIMRDGTTSPKSSAFIRLLSPLTDPVLNGRVFLTLHSNTTTTLPLSTDVCIIQRNAFEEVSDSKLLIRALKDAGVKLVLDTDDAFSDMSPTHPEFNSHQQTLKAFNYLISESEQIWISTPHLAKKIQASNKVVVRNSLDRRLWDGGNLGNAKGTLKIIYMGTVSHDADFKLVFPVLEKLAEKYPEAFSLSVIGAVKDLPNRKWITRLVQPPGVALYPRFVKWFKDQGPFDIGLAPLEDTEFNRSKSDIKCLDYLAAGIIPVVSDVEAYKNKELDNYIIRVGNNTKAWEEKLEEIINSIEDFRKNKPKIISTAQKYIEAERSSTKTAAQLLRLIEGLTKK